MLIQCTQLNDFSIDSSHAESASFDEINIQPSDQFVPHVNSMLIPTIMFYGANESTANDEFNDSLENECQSNNFNIFDFENHLHESNAIEHDSLESIDDNISTANSNAFTATATTSNCEQTPNSIQSNEINEITNEIPESNITKAIETECNNDSEEYDFEDIPGIEIAQYNAKNEQNSLIARILFVSFIGSIAEREHMKWKNAVDFPNNPYSPEALQRRLSQSSNNALLDIDGFKNKMNTQRPESPQRTEPLTVNLSESKMDPIRFAQFLKF